MTKRRRGVEVCVITTPNDSEVVAVKALNDFKRSVTVNASYTPENNAVYRRFKEKMSSAKARF
jgi:hypothetical protein